MSVDKGFSSGFLWGFTVVFVSMSFFCMGMIQLAHQDKELQIYEHCQKTGNYLFEDNKRLIKCEVK